MAFGNQLELTYSVQDAKGKVGSFNIQLPDNTDIPTLQADFAPSTAVLVDDVIDGAIVGSSASIGVDLSGANIKNAPIQGADVEEGALFTFRSTEGAPTRFRIPTFDETFGMETGQTVDTSDTDVDALVQRILQGDTQGATTVRWADSRGNNIASLISAKDQFKRTRK